jgi:U3 small nucleolar RNA-associated protein 21
MELKDSQSVFSPCISGSGFIDDIELENEITFHTSFLATSLLHPATYLNKVLIGSSTGELQLWNIRSCSLIHTFPATSASPITSLAQSPAIDVIAIGQADGAIRIHDLRMDETIMQFSQTHSVTDLAFRMDGPAVLASSSQDGSISMWDLAKKRVSHTQRGAHDTAIAGMQWVQGQPLLITSGADNYVKVRPDTLLPEKPCLTCSNGCLNPPMPYQDCSNSVVAILPLLH